MAKLNQEDKFGLTHTCYYQTKVSSNIPTKDEEPTKKKKAYKMSKKQTAAGDHHLPFQQNLKKSRKAFFYVAVQWKWENNQGKKANFFC